MLTLALSFSLSVSPLTCVLEVFLNMERNASVDSGRDWCGKRVSHFCFPSVCLNWRLLGANLLSLGRLATTVTGILVTQCE